MKALQNQDNYQLPAQVKRAAIAVPDRALLREFYEASSKQVKPVAIEFDLDDARKLKSKLKPKKSQRRLRLKQLRSLRMHRQ